ncbi:MAG: hypothetical protein IPJ30_23900 [Acidobacteria bacterium]|nr:hypothetical protein [Acidobacteriota bacterium]
MELPELERLAKAIETYLSETESGYSYRIIISNPESPNPSCVVQIEGAYALDCAFWANNEYVFEGFEHCPDPQLISESGFVQTEEMALELFTDYCKRTIGRS